jgi:hypothetical protein
MVSLLARELALMKLAWWGGAITSHWTGARVSGLLVDNFRLSRLRARPVNSTVMRFPFATGLMEIVTAILIHLVVPLIGLSVFLRLRHKMLEAEIENPPVIPLFIIFATYGGWLMIVLTLLFWYWSGMALLGALYLMFLAPLVMIVVAVWSYRNRRLSRYHYGSFLASAGYPIIPFAVILSRIIVGRIYGWD